MSREANPEPGCCCGSLDDLAVVPMGYDGFDQRVFASLQQVKRHGGNQWWLYVSTCGVCGQNWMIAQDERIYDNYYLSRISRETMQQVVDQDQWPDAFMHYESVLRLGRTMSTAWTFLDPRSPALTCTADDLRRERPDITIEEIAYLLAIPIEDAARFNT